MPNENIITGDGGWKYKTTNDGRVLESQDNNEWIEATGDRLAAIQNKFGDKLGNTQPTREDQKVEQIERKREEPTYTPTEEKAKAHIETLNGQGNIPTKAPNSDKYLEGDMEYYDDIVNNITNDFKDVEPADDDPSWQWRDRILKGDNSAYQDIVKENIEKPDEKEYKKKQERIQRQQRLNALGEAFKSLSDIVLGGAGAKIQKKENKASSWLLNRYDKNLQKYDQSKRRYNEMLYKGALQDKQVRDQMRSGEVSYQRELNKLNTRLKNSNQLKALQLAVGDQRQDTAWLRRLALSNQQWRRKLYLAKRSGGGDDKTKPYALLVDEKNKDRRSELPVYTESHMLTIYEAYRKKLMNMGEKGEKLLNDLNTLEQNLEGDARDTAIAQYVARLYNANDPELKKEFQKVAHQIIGLSGIDPRNVNTQEPEINLDKWMQENRESYNYSSEPKTDHAANPEQKEQEDISIREAGEQLQRSDNESFPVIETANPEEVQSEIRARNGVMPEQIFTGADENNDVNFTKQAVDFVRYSPKEQVGQNIEKLIKSPDTQRFIKNRAQLPQNEATVQEIESALRKSLERIYTNY